MTELMVWVVAALLAVAPLVAVVMWLVAARYILPDD